MKYKKLLDVLYGTNRHDILEILNSAIYVADYHWSLKESLVFHTGFTFTTQNEKKLDLLYDYYKDILIKQVRNANKSFPQINGIIACKQDESVKYLNWYKEVLICSIHLDNNTFGGIPIDDSYCYLDSINSVKWTNKESGEESVITAFKIFDGEKLIKEYPLQRNFEYKLFWNGVRFKIYNEYNKEIDEDNPYEHYSESDAFYDATDGQLGYGGQEGWTSIGRGD